MSEERRQDEATSQAPKTPSAAGDTAAAQEVSPAKEAAAATQSPAPTQSPDAASPDQGAHPAPVAGPPAGGRGGGTGQGEARPQPGGGGQPSGKRGRGERRRGRDPARGSSEGRAQESGRGPSAGRASEGGRGPGPSGRGHGYGATPRLVPIPPPDVLQQIVVAGDASVTVEWGEKIGKALRGKVQLGNLRRIYGTLKRLQLGEFDQAAQREVVLLRPRLAYTVKRQSSATGLVQVLDPAVKLVSTRPHLNHLIDFFEAILAYHRE